MTDDDDFRIRPGRQRDAGAGSPRQAKGLVAQVRQASARAGFTAGRAGGRRSGGTGTFGRGRRAALSVRLRPTGRRVIVKARTVRHFGRTFRAASITRHLTYLQREGVSRSGQPGDLFDARTDGVEGKAFADRCEGDRHHFRFIVSPEDAGEMQDLRAFTRELMQDASRDLGTQLDWVAVDHWNTDNPHIHVLVRGVRDDGQDLVIDRDYIRQGLRDRAEERATLELGPRSEREIAAALGREVEAERWTKLDVGLRELADEGLGVADLRPGDPGIDPDLRGLMIGRAMKLEQLGLADRIAPACWTLKPGAEEILREMSTRGDIIKTMHRAMMAEGRSPAPGSFALHDEHVTDPIIGRLVERGLHDELAGTAYAVIDGADGRTHHLRFTDLEMTGDAHPGAIVELRRWQDREGKDRLSLATRSDLSLQQQVSANGATWLDRELLARSPSATGNGFGQEIRDAMQARSDRLVDMGLARRQGAVTTFNSGLIDTLRQRDIAQAASAIAARTGLQHQPGEPGDRISGTYRQRINLASGRFAMIDDGLGFQLVPWRPSLDQQLGQQVGGIIAPGGGVEWQPSRQRGMSL